jgi:hypothetical protein
MQEDYIDRVGKTAVCSTCGCMSGKGKKQSPEIAIFHLQQAPEDHAISATGRGEFNDMKSEQECGVQSSLGEGYFTLNFQQQVPCLKA